MKLKNNPYYYLFYKINVFLVELFDRYDETKTLIIVCILWSNILNQFYALVLILIKFPIKEEIAVSEKFIIIVFAIINLFINHYFLIRKERHLKIMEYYKNESKRQSVIGSLTVALFIILTFVSLFAWKPLDYVH